MEKDILKITVLKADEGMVLTNGKTYSSVGGSVYIGKNDSPDNWHEITEEAYSEIVKAEAETVPGAALVTQEDADV